MSRRVDLLYLVDSILQSSLKPGRKGCGPDGAAGQAFPRVVAAALPRLVAALASAQDGAQKAEKVRPDAGLTSWLQAQWLGFGVAGPDARRGRHSHMRRLCSLPRWTARTRQQ